MPESDDEVMAKLAAMGSGGAGPSDEDVTALLNAPPDPNPLDDVDYTGDVPEDSRRELSALAQGFQDRARREEERFRLATDSEYWFVFCFKSRADKDRFLRRAGLLGIGDKYLDGYAAARELGISMVEDGD